MKYLWPFIDHNKDNVANGVADACFSWFCPSWFVLWFYNKFRFVFQQLASDKFHLLIKAVITDNDFVSFYMKVSAVSCWHCQRTFWHLLLISYQHDAIDHQHFDKQTQHDIMALFYQEIRKLRLVYYDARSNTLTYMSLHRM